MKSRAAFTEIDRSGGKALDVFARYAVNEHPNTLATQDVSGTVEEGRQEEDYQRPTPNYAKPRELASAALPPPPPAAFKHHVPPSMPTTHGPDQHLTYRQVYGDQPIPGHPHPQDASTNTSGHPGENFSQVWPSTVSWVSGQPEMTHPAMSQGFRPPAQDQAHAMPAVSYAVSHRHGSAFKPVPQDARNVMRMAPGSVCFDSNGGSYYVDQGSMCYPMSLAASGGTPFGFPVMMGAMPIEPYSISTGSVNCGAQLAPVSIAAVPAAQQPHSMSQLVQVTRYNCGYCGRVKLSATTRHGRVRIRCDCGGKHRDNVPRLHGMWSPVQSLEPNSDGKRVSMMDRFGVAGIKGPNGISSAVRQQLAQKSKAMAAKALAEQQAAAEQRAPEEQQAMAQQEEMAKQQELATTAQNHD